MWGNKLGWAISAVLMFAYGAVIGLFTTTGGVSPPTQLALDPGNLAPVILTPAPGKMVDMAEEGDAGPLYRQATQQYDFATFDQFLHLTTPTAEDVARLDALAPLLKATHLARMSLFAANPEEIIGYGGEKRPLEDLFVEGDASAKIGLLFIRRNLPAEARQYLEAAFSLGAKLYAERITLDEFQHGATLMSEASIELRVLDPDRAVQWDEFRAALIANAKHSDFLLSSIRSIDPATIGAHAGDVFVFADKSAERMWRVESVLAMGRLVRFVADKGRRGDKASAGIRLERLANDPDAAVRAAAKAALELINEK